MTEKQYLELRIIAHERDMEFQRMLFEMSKPILAFNPSSKLVLAAMIVATVGTPIGLGLIIGGLIK